MSRPDRRAFLAAAAALPLGRLRAGDRPGTGPFDRLMAEFLNENRVPGAALAVSKGSLLVYARGYGVADRATGTPVGPTSLFRIASVSKPITAVAVVRLAQRGLLGLDQPVRKILGLPATTDRRWDSITVRHLLQHTGGWDRDASFDPMFRSVTIAREMGCPAPAPASAVIAYMTRRPLDFDPGEKSVYSNFGYCLLGRAIERVTKMTYEKAVRRLVLEPLGVRRTRLGKTTPAARAPGEVAYTAARVGTGKSVFPPLDRDVPWPYGAWCLEAMDAHGGWLSTAVDLVRFASAFDDPEGCPILGPEWVETMFARPEGSAGFDAEGRPKDVYYGCGWSVRPVRAGGRNTWHNGRLDGTSSLLVRRHDGLNWAVLFNTDRNPDGEALLGLIDPLMHRAADAVGAWPQGDLFGEYL